MIWKDSFPTKIPGSDGQNEATNSPNVKNKVRNQSNKCTLMLPGFVGVLAPDKGPWGRGWAGEKAESGTGGEALDPPAGKLKPDPCRKPRASEGELETFPH